MRPMARPMMIGDRNVGDGQPCLIVAEVAQAHDGSLGTAHAFIDIVARSGCDAVKFQTHLPSAESTAREKFRVQFSLQDKSRYDYWVRTSFSPDQWRGLADHAKKAGLVFLSSPFSVEAVHLLDDLGMPAWKIGSGEVGNGVLLDHVLKTRKPVLLSSGMSNWTDLDETVRRIKESGSPLLIYQCTSRYPTPPAQVGLNILAEIRKRYDVPAGLSDHSGMVYYGIAAAALGAASVEVHVTMNQSAFGPDVPASLDPMELAMMVKGIRAVEESLRNPVDKDALASSFESMRQLFGRSIVARHLIKAGAILTEKNLSLKKPGGGIPPQQWQNVLGKKVIRDLAPDDLLEEKDIV